MVASLSLNELAKEVHNIATTKGWYEPSKTDGEAIALMHSELSEALEELREYKPACYLPEDSTGTLKPEGWGIELIDCIIRILDFLQYKGCNIENLMDLKIEYNKTRPYRHGSKRF